MTQAWFYVRRRRTAEEPDSLNPFEVQLLDDDGRAIAVGYLNEATDELFVAGVRIPEQVLAAAKRRPEGQGDYVGPDGRSLPPY